MKVKKVKCPMCHGTGVGMVQENLISGYLDWKCGFCNAELVVSQKKRMEYVRRFKKELIE